MADQYLNNVVFHSHMDADAAAPGGLHFIKYTGNVYDENGNAAVRRVMSFERSSGKLIGDTYSNADGCTPFNLLHLLCLWWLSTMMSAFLETLWWRIV